uniref:Ribosomal protein S1 n=1 Tax=Laurencieae sp. TaxID=2007162 RepID=A0A1Z1M305_9FLOR|nr:ribosomal protein S1 [Laurencieae sp.]
MNHIKNNSFGNILQKYQYDLHNGDIIAGTIIHKESLGFLVNIGTKVAGYLPQEETNLKSTIINKDSLFLVNTTREFFLMAKNVSSKQPILSIKRLEYIRAWKRIKQIYLEDIMVNLKIAYTNKGGIITYLEGIQGFIPKSHIEIRAKKFIGETKKNTYIYCKILTINEHKNQLILSNKSAVFVLSQHKFKLGEVLYGKVILIRSYGLFLDIYGIKALLHVSEISHKHVDNMNLLFNIGKIIKIKVIHINNKRGQLSVSKRYLKHHNKIV